MSTRRTFLGLLATILFVSLTGPAIAGGYAVVRLDEAPTGVRAGVPWEFGFMVLQHDVTPNSDVLPVVRAAHRESAEEVSAIGVQEGAVGHFVAELTLPRPGEWKWSIEPQPYAETSFPTLMVATETAGDLWPASLLLLDFRNSRLTGEPSVEASDRPDGVREVEIVDAWAFTPYSLEIEVGTSVVWINESKATHTVTGDALAFQDSGPLAPGQSFTAAFHEPGAYRYHCAPHPGMVGEIVVT